MKATKHIGILGVSAEGAALCYKTICVESSSILGQHIHPEVSMHTYSFHRHVDFMNDDDFDSVAELLLKSSEKLVKVGADFLICPDNTAHKALDRIRDKLPLPLIHIGEVVAEAAAKEGMKKLLLLGTRSLMEGPVYGTALTNRNIDYEIPGPDDRKRVDDIVFDELVMSKFEDASRVYLSGLIESSSERGCDGVILGCTEIPLIIEQTDSALPILDSTRLLARAAIHEAIGTR